MSFDGRPVLFCNYTCAVLSLSSSAAILSVIILVIENDYQEPDECLKMVQSSVKEWGWETMVLRRMHLNEFN